jgi:hypothetical protein
MKNLAYVALCCAFALTSTNLHADTLTIPIGQQVRTTG